MGHDHNSSSGAGGHSHERGSNERSLTLALALTGAFLLIEVVGGVLTHSLSLLSDAAHMLTDVAALAIALVAVRLGRRPADRKRTFGYYRFEILAAAVNAAALFFVGFYILFEALQRFRGSPTEVRSVGMFGIAAAGLAVNLLSMRILATGSTEGGMNMKGAYLEVWSDLLGSLAVLAGALLIRFTGWWWVDPVLAIGIGLWVLPRTWGLLSESVNILLEGVPEGLELAEIDAALTAVPGVAAVHDLHVWAITSGKNSLTAHLVLAAGDEDSQQAVLTAARRMLAERFELSHTTLQIESADYDCPPAEAVNDKAGRLP